MVPACTAIQWLADGTSMYSYLVEVDGTSMYSCPVEADGPSMYSYLVEADGTSMYSYPVVSRWYQHVQLSSG